MTEEEKKAAEQKELETVVEAVTEKTIPAILEKLKNEQPLRKQIFADGSASERQELAEKKEAAAEFLRKRALGHDTKALSAGSATSGAELVPTYFSDNVIEIAQKHGLVRKHAYNWPMQGINVDVPSVGTVSAYRLATDTTPMTVSKPSTGAVQLRAKTVGVLIPVSRTLLNNANVNLVDILAILAGRAIAKLEDQWGFLGLASGEGIFQNTNVKVETMATGKDTFAEVEPEDLLKVEDQIDENFIDENSMRWIMSRSVLNIFRAQRNAIGSDKQAFLLPGYGDNTPPTLWGYPYDTSSVMPKRGDAEQAGKKFLALVDYSNIIHGDAKEYTLEISDQATIVDGETTYNTFQQNMAAVKVWGQIDIKLANAASAFGVLKTAAS